LTPRAASVPGRAEQSRRCWLSPRNALFNDLARLAYRNCSNLPAAERLLRLAFKAQSQGRAKVETLGSLRNPPMATVGTIHRLEYGGGSGAGGSQCLEGWDS